MKVQLRCKHLALALATLGTYVPAWGQSTATDPSASSNDDVVVVYGKRPQSRRTIAGTASAVQGDQLEALGAQDQEDIFKLTPGVQINKGDPDRALPTIRGVGTVTSSNSLGTQQGTTGIYIEDVPFTDPWGFVGSADLAPFDLEQVEVLRGPQGALYGSASLGGAVLYQLKKPALGKQQFSVLSSVETIWHGGLSGSIYAMGNFPIGTSSAVRAVVFDRHQSGYITNAGTGKERANSLRERGGRILFVTNPIQDLLVTGTILHQETHIDDTFGVSPDSSQLRISTPTASPRTSAFTLTNLKADYDAGFGKLTSNTAYVEKKSDATTDLTRRLYNIGALVGPGTPLLASVISPLNAKGKAFSQEFRIASKVSEPISYVIGAFYQRARFDADGGWIAPGGAKAWGPLGVLLPNDSIVDEHDHAVATEKAIFADVEYAFGNGFSVGAGGRKYRNGLEYNTHTVLLTQLLQSNEALTESGFTPKFTVKYRWNDQVWYALASRGYRFGGVNPIVSIPFKSDSLWNYETGLRLSLAPNVRADLSAFVLDWKDAQVNAILPGPVPVNGIANVGAAKIKGLEGTLSWKILPSFTFNATLAYTDAKTSTAFTSNNGVVVASGTTLPSTAKLQSYLQATYRFEGPFESSGTFTATHSHVGHRRLAIDSAETLPGYNTSDLRLAFARDAWEATLFVANLTDRRGVSGGQVTPGIGSPAYTDYFLVKPRTVGLTLRYDY